MGGLPPPTKMGKTLGYLKEAEKLAIPEVS
ncbi:hypothetical protein NIES267_02690 [Calothrix parasitica NIES-267]|uniref:Uncharacterized protein n=1 Tax=Calothrix parasitica NIES-267 TaxID=1973488 RepID=A0A1Z4LHZ0_9CYAN|nr:hypothetical protein NIES267_02690 [Calothrix parasitica NIES-267]